MILLYLYYTSHIPLYIDMQQIIRLDSINFMEQVVMLSNVSKLVLKDVVILKHGIKTIKP